jgi:hypothetical protein
MVAAKLANMGEGRPAKTAQICAVSQDEAAALLNVSRRWVQAAVKVRADAVPEVVQAAEQGIMSERGGGHLKTARPRRTA